MPELVGYIFIIGLAFGLLIGIALTVNSLENSSKDGLNSVVLHEVCSSFQLASARMSVDDDLRDVHSGLSDQVSAGTVLILPEHIVGSSWSVRGVNNSLVISTRNITQNCNFGVAVRGQSAGGKVKLQSGNIAGVATLEVSQWP